MNTLVAVCRTLTGLFVGDGWLALAILTVVALAGIATSMMPQIPMAAGVILLFGCLCVLLANVLGAARD